MLRTAREMERKHIKDPQVKWFAHEGYIRDSFSQTIKTFPRKRILFNHQTLPNRKVSLPLFWRWKGPEDHQFKAWNVVRLLQHKYGTKPPWYEASLSGFIRLEALFASHIALLATIWRMSCLLPTGLSAKHRNVMKCWCLVGWNWAFSWLDVCIDQRWNKSGLVESWQYDVRSRMRKLLRN